MIDCIVFSFSNNRYWLRRSSICRRNHRRCSVRKGVLNNFSKFKGKHRIQSECGKACNFIKKETLAQVFSCEFWEISKNTFFTEHLQVTASTYVRDVYSRCDKLFKCYFLLITCAATRAVHFELISNFSSNSLILALRRCFARWGTQSQLLVIISRYLKP